MSGSQRYPRRQIGSSPSPSTNEPLFPSTPPRTPLQPAHVDALEQAYNIHGPKYKLVLPAHRTWLCEHTGLGPGELRSWWMTRARNEKRERRTTAKAVTTSDALAGQSSLAQPPPPPLLVRPFSLPSILFPPKLPIKRPNSTRPLLSLPTDASPADLGDSSNYLPPLAKSRPQSLKFYISNDSLESDDMQRVDKRRKVERPVAKVKQWRAAGGDRGATDSMDDPRHDALLQGISHFLPSVSDHSVEIGRSHAARALSAEELEERAYDRLRASVGEVDDIVFLEAESLSIGSWLRTADSTSPRPDLRVYFSPGLLSFCFWTSHELTSTQTFFHTRITLPLASLISIKFLSASDTSPALILFIRDRALPLDFHAARPSTSPPTWVSVPNDFTPGAQASHVETYAVTVRTSSHAFGRLLELPRFLAPAQGDDILGKIWTAVWPTDMRSQDVVRCLEGPPCASQWGHDEMVAFWYTTPHGELELRRSFVLPPPPSEQEMWQLCVASESLGEHAVKVEEDDSARRHSPSADRTPPHEATFNVFRKDQSLSPAFDIRPDDRLQPSASYLTPPPELGRRDVDWHISHNAPLFSLTQSTTCNSQSFNSIYEPQSFGYEEDWDTVALRPTSPSPTPEFDYTQETAFAFQVWRDDTAEAPFCL